MSRWSGLRWPLPVLQPLVGVYGEFSYSAAARAQSSLFSEDAFITVCREGCSFHMNGGQLLLLGTSIVSFVLACASALASPALPHTRVKKFGLRSWFILADRTESRFRLTFKMLLHEEGNALANTSCAVPLNMLWVSLPHRLGKAVSGRSGNTHSEPDCWKLELGVL